MLRKVLTPLIGVVTFCLLLVALLTCFAAFIPVALVKAAAPLSALRRAASRGLVWIVGVPWSGCNRLICRTLHGRSSSYRLDDALDPQRSWLLLCNHQSWADILILVDALRGRAPFPRFFLKRQLVWVPVIGFAAWALDMPFMRRYSREAVAANPELARRDLEATRRACQRYRQLPVTVVNFVEGTRCTPTKRAARRSPFRHLLRPKSGGLAFALSAMGDQFAGLVDVTIAYRATHRGLLWSFLCGEQAGVRVHVRVRPIPLEFVEGEYQHDAEFRNRFQHWLNTIWTEKDAELASLTSKVTGRRDDSRLVSGVLRD